ncbi:hypothetical protein FGO68_gene17031 [Halteria grandinella]|uniref:Uncharacterized protein n=1 Tax=Halteria grandinella TaxID=5974 RepID=A0A8J8NIM3_HALGN|nr:hypothetical protein FGO68_gene17031 [Halteria grandinella]
MACFSGSAYKEDVNIGYMNFYPIEIKLTNNPRVSLLDSIGRYLGDQLEQEKMFKDRKREEEEAQRRKLEEEVVHPKIKEAGGELEERKRYLRGIEGEVERMGMEIEAVMDLIVAYSLDNEKLEAQMSEIERARGLVMIEKKIKEETSERSK